MVVTNVLLVLLLLAIIADIWYRHATHAHHEEGWLAGLSVRFAEQEDRFVAAVRRPLELMRKDITDLWALQAESEGRIIRFVEERDSAASQHLEEVADHIDTHIDRLQEGAVEAAATAHAALEQQLTDLTREVTDPTILRMVRALVVAFQLEGVVPMEPAAAPIVEGPLAPHPVPNVARQLEAARFSEETISNGMQELVDGAAARGQVLHPAEARHQVMLMLNGVDIDD